MAGKHKKSTRKFLSKNKGYQGTSKGDKKKYVRKEKKPAAEEVEQPVAQPGDAPFDAVSDEEVEAVEEFGYNLPDGIDVEGMDIDDLFDTEVGTGSGEDEEARHQLELEELKEVDPEFYAHLQSEAADLLEFKGEKPEVKEKGLTLVELNKIADGVREGSIRAIKKLLGLYSVGCHLGEKKDNVGILDSNVFHHLMRLCLSELSLHEVLAKALGIATEGEDIDVSKSQALPKFKRWIQAFLGNTVHIISQNIAMGMTDPDLIVYMLQSLRPYTRFGFFTSFGKLSLMLMRQLTGILLTIDVEPSVMIEAFLVLRELMISNPLIIRDTLKYVYMSYIRSSKSLLLSPPPLLLQCFVELYHIDVSTTYEIAFVYIRQLALHLRNAVLQPSKLHSEAVYNAKFMASLRVWTAVLTRTIMLQTADDLGSELSSLRYPLIQIICGVVELLPSAIFIPLRLQCVRLLLALGEEKYIPIAPYIFRTLELLQVDGGDVKGPNKPLELASMLRVAKGVSTSRRFHDDAIEESIELLRRFCTIHSCSIAFPDMVIGIVKLLTKKVATTSKKGIPMTARKEVKALVEQLKHNSEWITEQRKNVDFAPKELTKVAEFEKLLKKSGTSPLDMYAKTGAKVVKKSKSKKSTNEGSSKRKNKPTNGKASKKARSTPLPVVGSESLLQGADVVEKFTMDSDSE